MKTIEQLKAEQEAALLKLTKEHEIAQRMPVVPKSVMECGKRAPWVSYSRETIADAVKVFKAFAPVLMAHKKGTFTTLQPEAEISSNSATAEHCGDYCAAIKVDQGEGFGPNVTLTFYAQTQAGLVRVNVEIEGKQFNRNYNYKWGAEVNEQRDGRTNRLVSRTLNPNRILSSLSDGLIRYSSGDMGPVKKSAHIVYMWVADNVQGTEFSHFLGQMENLAEQMK